MGPVPGDWGALIFPLTWCVASRAMPRVTQYPLCLEPPPRVCSLRGSHGRSMLWFRHVSTSLLEQPGNVQAIKTIYLNTKQKEENTHTEKNCKHFFVKPMSVLLHTFHVVLCKCLICVINKVNASRSAGTDIRSTMEFHFFPALWLRAQAQAWPPEYLGC